MKKSLKLALGSGAAMMLPLLAMAQSGGFYSIESSLQTVIRILNSYIIPLIIGIAVIYFLAGLIKYVTAGGDEEKRKEARNTMIYGIIAIFVMVSVWGLVNLLRNSFALDNQVPTDLPRIPNTQ